SSSQLYLHSFPTRRSSDLSVWTTFSFVYPLLFERGEKLAVSDAIFGDDIRAYPPTVPWRMPANDFKTAFVVEANSPFRSQVEARSEEHTSELQSRGHLVCR